MQFIDLKTQYERIKPEVLRRLETVLDHGGFIMGPEIEELEGKLAALAGTAHCLSCASGTDALLLVLMAKGIGPGDAVITTPFTFVATAEVVALLGATPVFADIDPATLLLDPDALAELLEHRVTARGRVRLPKELRLRAVLPVDLFGLPCDYDRILPLARRHGLFVLGDAAQSFGARYHGKPVGSLCEVTATSFFPAKPLGCYGDGGAVLTDDGELLDILQSLRVHGRGSHKYENVRVGLNGRLDTLQAAVLLAKLPIFEEEVEARSQVASRYRELLAERVQLQCEPEGLRSVWAQYSILTDNRDACMAQLHAAGVPTNIYYPHPLHLQRAFTTLGYREGDFPHAEAAAKRIFSLPMHPYLDPSTQRRIVDILVANL